MFRGDSKSNSSIVLHRPQSANSRQEQELIQKSSRALADATDPLEKLRLLCMSRGASGILALGRIFRRIDHDGKKKLNLDEFLNGIKETGLDFDKQDAVELFNYFDTYRHGSISLDEFLTQIRPPMSDERRAIVDQAFRKLDKSDNGVTTIEDVRKVYSVTAHPSYMSGDDSADTIFTQFLAHFDTEGSIDGQITHEDFLNYYSCISVSIDNDCYFNLMMRKAYNL